MSAEVRKQRQHEAALLSGYQAYLKVLLEALRTSSPTAHNHKGGGGRGGGAAGLAHARTGVRCMARLLAGLPHFNYTSGELTAVSGSCLWRQPATLGRTVWP